MTADFLRIISPKFCKICVLSDVLFKIQALQGLFDPEDDCDMLFRNGVTSYEF